MDGEPTGEVHLPAFITPPGETDVLYIIVVVAVVVVIFLLGTLYFRLHALPEQMAHRSSRTQYQLVAILALIALFTHNGIFWIAALLLAAVQIPDFMTPVRSIAGSLERMSPPLASAGSDAPQAHAAGPPAADDAEAPAHDPRRPSGPATGGAV